MSAGHHHGHDHGQNTSRNTLLLALVITLGYAVVEAVGGWLANSLALMGDAGHMATDALALAAGALAAWVATQPATHRHSFGFKRAEVVGALFNVVFMYLIVAAITWSAIKRFQHPQDVEFSSVLLIGSVGLVINIGVAWLLSRGQQNLNTRGAMLHVIGDLLGSVAAIAAGAVIWLTGWMPIDPILSLFICLLILISSTRLFLETLRVVMEGVPQDLELADVQFALAQVPGVEGIHHLHIWSLSSEQRALSAHVEADANCDWGTLLHTLEAKVAHDFNISHSTFQPEFDPRCKPDSRL